MSMPQGSPPRRSGRRKPIRQKHVPIRTCIVCRETSAKRSLTRIVRDPEGEIMIDPTGKRNGRGAYLCDKPGCWDRALSTSSLGKALNADINLGAQHHIREFAASLHASDSLQPGAADSREPVK